jgi:acetyl-CoA synthetase
MKTQKDKMLKTREVAERLDVSHATVVRWIRSGELGGVKVGRVWRVYESELARYISQRSTRVTVTADRGV